MKRILIFSSVQLWDTHHSEVVELIWKMSNEGNKIFLISCDGDLASCPANPKHNMLKCIECRSITNYTEKKLMPQNCYPIRLNLEAENASFFIPSTEELLKITYRNMPIGRLVASQLADEVNGVYLDLQNKKIESRAIALINNGIALYLQTIKLIEQYQIDDIYTWNGRRSSDGPPLYAAKYTGKNFHCFISGGRTNYIQISNSTSVQDPEIVIKSIEEYTESNNLDIIREEGRQYFTSDVHGDIDQIGYKRFNVKSINPRNIDKQKPMLLLVTSSPTETIHLKEHVDFYNSKPYETMLSIVSNSLIKQKYQVVVRWHPAKINLGQKDKAIINDLINSDSEIMHIRPEDQDDTYKIVKDAAVILTFGSTVGYVAALTGKPVVIAGPIAKVFKTSFYSAKSPKQATELLLSDLEPRDPIEIEMIGYYAKNFGLKMENILMKKEGKFLNSYLIVNESNQYSSYVPIHPKTNYRKSIKSFVNLVNVIKKLYFITIKSLLTK